MKFFSKETRRRMREAAKKVWTPAAREAQRKRRTIVVDLRAMKRLYISGLSMKAVGEQLGLSSQAVCNRLHALGVPTRKCGTTGHHWAAEHHNWKGDSASYNAFHSRLNRMLGKSQCCGVCGSQDDPKTIYEWANLTGRYYDLLDYKRMCRKCHRAYDKSQRVIRKSTRRQYDKRPDRIGQPQRVYSAQA